GALGISVPEQQHAPDSPKSTLMQRWEYDPIPLRDSTSSSSFNATMQGIDQPGNHGLAPSTFPEDQRHSHIGAIDPKGTISTTEQYSLFAPSRFSVIFGNIRSIHDNIRVYSDPFYYAG